MADLPRTYRYQYRLSLRYGSWAHSYELVGRHGALHLHINDMGEKHADRYSAGLEIHYRSPPEYMDDKPPTHDECWLMKCPCWHDGTTLYAETHFLPMFDGVNHERLFLALATEADERFSRGESSPRKGEG